MGKDSNSGLIERDLNAQATRKAKKQAYVKKTQQKAETFSFERITRKGMSDALKEMVVSSEDSVSQNRLFSIRAWDRKGDEVWSDDRLTLDQFQKDFPYMVYWATKAKLADLQVMERVTPVAGTFYFRRVQ
jgi:hypothetical protein